MRVDRMVKATVDALEDIKGHEIVVLDVRRMTALFDRVIVVSGDSSRQNKALANNVQEKLKALGATVHGIEGADSGEWILVDLGAVIVHIMQPAIRQYYNLEELWGKSAAPPRRRAAGAARS
jgi:ribosome-associated protein